MARSNGREAAFAEAVALALRDLQTMPLNGKSRMFVKEARIRRRRSLDPTPFQTDLYNWIRKSGFVPWHLTLGMHFGMLGGLLCRGLVEQVTVNGVKGIVAR